MLLRTVYTLRPVPPAALPHLSLPLIVPFAEGVQAVLSVGDTGILSLAMERRVDPSALELVTDTGRYRELPDGSEEPIPAIRLQDEDPPDHVFADDVANALSFLTDTPLQLVGSLEQDRFVPENDTDRKTLQDLGTDEPAYDTATTIQVRSFNDVPITAELIQGLVARRAGLRLYADALKLSSRVAEFRDLWRTLESAFGVQDNDLITALLSYPPAQEMGFDRTELRALLVLRNRASHAASRSGLQELVTVEHDCEQQLARLKNLVERVILTKRTWGYRTAGVEELLPLGNYIRSNDDQGVVIGRGRRQS